MIGIKKDAVAEDHIKSIKLFDLTSTPVKEDDQLYILQYPVDPDNYNLQAQLKQLASPCKKVIGKRLYMYNGEHIQWCLSTKNLNVLLEYFKLQLTAVLEYFDTYSCQHFRLEPTMLRIIGD